MKQKHFLGRCKTASGLLGIMREIERLNLIDELGYVVEFYVTPSILKKEKKKLIIKILSEDNEGK